MLPSNAFVLCRTAINVVPTAAPPISCWSLLRSVRLPLQLERPWPTALQADMQKAQQHMHMHLYLPTHHTWQHIHCHCNQMHLSAFTYVTRALASQQPSVQLMHGDLAEQ